MTIGTIGVYGWTLEHFLDALQEASVRLVIDVRQRRGVRGSEYAWANAARLQQTLAASGVSYSHEKELAPTTDLRLLQYLEDDRQGVGKRSRVELAPAYRERYVREILQEADLHAVVQKLPHEGIATLMCVERDPEACHRSLVAGRLASEYGASIVHLRPPG